MIQPDSAVAGCVLILRGYEQRDAVVLAELAWETGIDLVEVSILGPSDWEAFAAIADRAGGRRRVGVGSLREPEAVHRAAAGGASFALSAGFTTEMAAAAEAAALDLIPGVLTPSEVIAALRSGCRTLKLFPAGVLGPSYLRALRGPFPEVAFIAVGGVGLDNAADFLDAGASGVGVGSSLLPAAPFGSRELTQTRASFESLLERLHSSRAIGEDVPC